MRCRNNTISVLCLQQLQKKLLNNMEIKKKHGSCAIWRGSYALVLPATSLNATLRYGEQYQPWNRISNVASHEHLTICSMKYILTIFFVQELIKTIVLMRCTKCRKNLQSIKSCPWSVNLQGNLCTEKRFCKGYCRDSWKRRNETGRHHLSVGLPLKPFQWFANKVCTQMVAPPVSFLFSNSTLRIIQLCRRSCSHL